jgi:glucose/mannose transport system permease protein
MITRRPSRFLLYITLIIASIFFLLPVYVLLVTGLKSFTEIKLTDMWNLPHVINFGGFFKDVFRGHIGEAFQTLLPSFYKAWAGDPPNGVIGLRQNFLNSVYLAVPATIISAMLGSMNGYVLAKWKFRGSDRLFLLMLFGMFIPYQSILIPLVQTLQKLRFFGFSMYGSLYGLILVHVVYGIPITTLIFRNYYATIPTELVEASKIDGAGILGIYRYILFPISMPGFVVVIIWQFTSIWNEFLFAVTVTSTPAVQPITVALNNLAGSYIVEWNVQMAGALIAALPTLLLYIFLGPYFMRGLLAGSLKG